MFLQGKFGNFVLRVEAEITSVGGAAFRESGPLCLNPVYIIVSVITSLFLSFQVKEGMFDKEKFDDLCWMMTRKKNFKGVPQGALLSERDCFKLFSLFNLLSEDRYPLVMIPEEVKHTDGRARECLMCETSNNVCERVDFRDLVDWRLAEKTGKVHDD